MSNKTSHDRRQFVHAAAILGTMRFGFGRSAITQANAANSVATPTMNTSLGALKQIDAGLLSVGFAESGPAQGPVVILLHGWPYDIHSFTDVAPILAAKGYRVITPYLRGYGSTRFLSDASIRNGQPSAIAADTIALMDALGLEKAVVAGFDWGARSANIMAALWPQRVGAMVLVSGYLISSQQVGKRPLPPSAELQWWYQFYFATDRGRAGYDKYRKEFSKLIWQLASPNWKFDDATFERSAKALENPDHVEIVIHNYRWRLGLADGESRYDDLEKRLANRSACLPSPWKAMPMALHIQSPLPTPRSLPENTLTGPSRAALDTTCLRKRPTHSRRRSSTSRNRPDRSSL